MKNLSCSSPHQNVHSFFHHNPPLKKDGILLIDKPSGMTSHDVVDRVRSILRTQKVGHSGTLDPLASGLMVLLINQGTKLSPYLLNQRKIYTFSVTLGIETDTWDSDGRVVDQKDVHLSCTVIQKGIEAMTGTKILKVPAYSAVKFKGRKLYDYARKHAKDGKTNMPEIYRLMSFDQLQIIDICPPHFKVSLRTSKGSFVRSWAYTIGQYLNVGGIVSGLQRTASEPYTLDQATNLEALKAYFKTSPKGKDTIPGFIILDDTLQDWPTYMVRGRWEKAISHGRIPEGMQWDVKHLLEKNASAEGVKVYSARTGHILVLLKYNDIGNKLKVACLFNEIVK